MQRTAPSSLPRRQEGGGSPAFMMANRIRAEQGPERAAQYLAAMEPYLAPGERTHIAYALGLPPIRQSAQQPPQQKQGAADLNSGGGMGPLGAIGGMGGIGNIMNLMQLLNGIQGSGKGSSNQLMQLLGGLMGNGGKK